MSIYNLFQIASLSNSGRISNFKFSSIEIPLKGGCKESTGRKSTFCISALIKFSFGFPVAANEVSIDT